MEGTRDALESWNTNLHAERGFLRQFGAGKTVYIGVMHSNMPHTGALPASWDLKVAVATHPSA